MTAAAASSTHLYTKPLVLCGSNRWAGPPTISEPDFRSTSSSSGRTPRIWTSSSGLFSAGPMRCHSRISWPRNPPLWAPGLAGAQGRGHSGGPQQEHQLCGPGSRRIQPAATICPGSNAGRHTQQDALLEKRLLLYGDGRRCADRHGYDRFSQEAYLLRRLVQAQRGPGSRHGHYSHNTMRGPLGAIRSGKGKSAYVHRSQVQEQHTRKTTACCPLPIAAAVFKGSVSMVQLESLWQSFMAASPAGVHIHHTVSSQITNWASLSIRVTTGSCNGPVSANAVSPTPMRLHAAWLSRQAGPHWPGQSAVHRSRSNHCRHLLARLLHAPCFEPGTVGVGGNQCAGLCRRDRLYRVCLFAWSSPSNSSPRAPIATS